MKSKITKSIVMSIVITAAAGASAQVILTGTNYSQSFADLNSGLPPGWSVRTNATSTNLGTAATFNTNNTSWGTQTGQFANYASTLNNSGTNFLGTESTTVQGNCTNRCPGIRQTTTLWSIDYGIGDTPAGFSALGTYADPGAFGATTQALSFGTALDNLDQPVWIRVAALNPSAGSNRCDTVGIDNFNLSYSASGTLTPIPLKIQLIGTNAVLTWSNASFALQSAPAATGAYTNEPHAASPYTNPVAGIQKYFRLKAN